LNSLYLKNNQIKKIPEEITQLPQLGAFYLEGNPIETPINIPRLTFIPETLNYYHKN
jgi:Leucine-rich repeat (LRR) protein